MENTVRDGEDAVDIITEGDYTYILYADFGASENLSEEVYAIKRIDNSSANHGKIRWSGGSKEKRHAADNLSGLTYKKLV